MKIIHFLSVMIFCILVALPSKHTNAQNSSIAPIFKISYDYRILNNQELRDEYEKGKINYSFGIDYIHDITPKISLKSGVRYVTIGYKTNDEDLQWGSEHDGNGGYKPDPILPYSGTIEHEYHYLQIPINLRTYLNSGIIKFYSEGGVSFNLSTKKDWLSSYDFNRVNYSVNLGLGIKTEISNRLSLYLNPTANYFVRNTLVNTISENLYSLGVEMGCAYRIANNKI